MKERFEVLDIFRGIFSSMVVLFHLSTFSDTPVINNPLVENADLFVDFFFVLSGFVITYSYQHLSDGRQFGRFYKKRLLRLYPLHFIMLMAFLVVELSKQALSAYVHVNELNNPDNNAFTFLTSLLLINSIKLPGVQDVSWNVPSWSISAEMIAYLVFGMTMIFVHKSNLFKQRNLVYLLVLGTAVSTLYGITHGFKLTYSFDYGFLRSVIGFFTGMLCFNTYAATRNRVRSLPAGLFHTAETLIIVLIPVLVWNKNLFLHAEYIYAFLFFGSIYTFAFEKGYISRSLRKVPLLSRIGTYSYSIYMTHTLILSIFNIVFIRILKFPPSAYAYLFVINYALIYFVSKWTYENIEMRFSPAGKRPAEPKTGTDLVALGGQQKRAL